MLIYNVDIYVRMKTWGQQREPIHSFFLKQTNKVKQQAGKWSRSGRSSVVKKDTGASSVFLYSVSLLSFDKRKYFILYNS